jgi:iron complex transport system ATP-binding protein
MILSAEGISKWYDTKPILQNIDFEIHSNEWVSILGPNGSGKSTLLSCIAGSTKINDGQIFLKGTRIEKYPVKERAKIIAYLTQEALPDMPNTVEEIVRMGRYPYQNLNLPWYQKEDLEIVEEVLSFTDTAFLRKRQMSELSGGERQRVAIALALAQEPEILLLDEPTTYLDIYYQLTFFDLLRKWQKKKKTTIISVLHDINLASLYSDRCFLLKEGKMVDVGIISEIVTFDNIKQTFGIEPILMDHPYQRVPQILLKGEKK